MSDVEKYGLFALLFVLVILALILSSGGEPAAAAEGGPARPVVIRSPAQTPPPRNSGHAPAQRAARAEGDRGDDARAVRTYTVQSVVGAQGPFHPDEPPVAYPGSRSVIAAPNVEGRVLHTVRQGETLSDIAKIHFGTTTRWRDILALNPGIVPSKLQVGQALVVQAPLAAAAPPATAAAPPVVAAPAATLSAPPTSEPASRTRLYVVKKGDTLGEIARRELGSARAADRLFEANKDVLKSPHALTAGMTLRLP